MSEIDSEHMDKMTLHEVIDFDKHTDILKVPNGWIYRCYDTQEGIVTAMAFVPEHAPLALTAYKAPKEAPIVPMSDEPFCS